jgi:hypothetical protein
MMCRYLQMDLFEPAHAGLAPGGLLIVIALLSDPLNAAAPRFRVRAGELASHFGNRAAFTIVHQREAAHSADDYSSRQAFAEIAVRRECK